MSINLNISTLANGGVQEKINAELKKVFENIMDPNTSPKDKRKVSIEIVLSPDEQRTTIASSVKVKSSLAPQLDVSTTILADYDFKTGEIFASERLSNATGQTFFGDDGYLRTDTGELLEEKENIIDFNKRKSAN